MFLLYSSGYLSYCHHCVDPTTPSMFCNSNQLDSFLTLSIDQALPLRVCVHAVNQELLLTVNTFRSFSTWSALVLYPFWLLYSRSDPVPPSLMFVSFFFLPLFSILIPVTPPSLTPRMSLSHSNSSLAITLIFHLQAYSIRLANSRRELLPTTRNGHS